MPSQRKSPQPKECRNCGKPFTPRTGWQKCCGEDCRRAWWRKGGVDDRAILKIVQPALDQLEDRLEARIRAAVDLVIQCHLESEHGFEP